MKKNINRWYSQHGFVNCEFVMSLYYLVKKQCSFDDNLAVAVGTHHILRQYVNKIDIFKFSAIISTLFVPVKQLGSTAMVNLVYCLFTFLAYEYSQCNLMCSLITITISVVLFFLALMDKDGSLVHQNRGVNSDSTGVPFQLHRTHHMKCPVCGCTT